MSPRVLFWVQHLLGVGHVFRAVRVANGLIQRGFEVSLAMGGPPVPGLELASVHLIELPCITAGPSGFNELVTPRGAPVHEEFKAERRARLLAAFSQIRPDILMLEAFPFGRRQMRFELQPLLERAHATRPRPLVICSVRDMLQEKGNPEREEETISLLRARFDHVVVHGDPRLVRLETTFPRVCEIEDRISYSGMVAPAAPSIPAQTGDYDVIVSAGGGAVGYRLLEGAILAKPLTTLAGARWVVSTGPNLGAEAAQRLRSLADRHKVMLVSFLPHLAARLAAARLSISQAGYNTVADVLKARCPAVLCPFAEGGETEQTVRARVLSARGLAAMIAEADLSPARIAAAIARALSLPRTAAADIDLNGAAGTAEILERLLRSRALAESPKLRDEVACGDPLHDAVARRLAE